MKVQMTVAAPWQSIHRRLVRRLVDRGFAVAATFDLQLARRSLPKGRGAACPLHGSERCACQYLVLRVGRVGLPASMIVLHGCDRTSKVVLMSATGSKLDLAVAAEICRTIEYTSPGGQGDPPPRCRQGSSPRRRGRHPAPIGGEARHVEVHLE